MQCNCDNKTAATTCKSKRKFKMVSEQAHLLHWNVNAEETRFVPFYFQKQNFKTFPGLFHTSKSLFPKDPLVMLKQIYSSCCIFPSAFSSMSFTTSLYISRIFHNFLSFSRAFQSWKKARQKFKYLIQNFEDPQ